MTVASLAVAVELLNAVGVCAAWTAACRVASWVLIELQVVPLVRVAVFFADSSFCGCFSTSISCETSELTSMPELPRPETVMPAMAGPPQLVRMCAARGFGPLGGFGGADSRL